MSVRLDARVQNGRGNVCRKGAVSSCQDQILPPTILERSRPLLSVGGRVGFHLWSCPNQTQLMVHNTQPLQSCQLRALLDKVVLAPGLRIRIHFIRIRIQLQHFRLNTDPDPGFWGPKIEKKITAEKKIKFFGSKTAIYLSLGLYKEIPRYRRSLQLSKEAIQHFRTWTFQKNFYFCGSFLPSWIWIRIWILNTDPDPMTQLNPDPIRIRIRNPAWHTMLINWLGCQSKYS